MHIWLPITGPLQFTPRRLSTFTAALCLICFSLAQGASQLTNTKRITAVQVGESAEGSKVIVTGDSLLDDYEAFRRGDRFYVRIPSADFVAAAPRFQGHGFEDVQVQKVGDSVVISFRLHPGANARVIGAGNRLEVIFTSPNHVASNNSANAVRNRVTRKSGAEKTPPRSYSKLGSDVAGPMPPDSPNTNTDYSVQPASPTTARSETLTDALRTNAVSRKAAGTPESTATPVTIATPYPTTSPYATPYQPATSTYTPAPIQPVGQTNGKFFGLGSRGGVFLQWARNNKTLSAVSGLAVMGLLAVVLLLLYRGRRNRRAAMAKASRVQPKYSPDIELEDMLTTSVATASTEVQPGGHVGQDAYESWSENTESDDSFLKDWTASSKADVTYSERIVPTPYNAENEEPWEYVPESHPQAYNSKVQEEREVFEL